MAELPQVIAVITEHQGHFRTCPCGGKLNHAAIPGEIREHRIGPHLTAVVGYLTGGQGISKRGVEEIVEPISSMLPSRSAPCRNSNRNSARRWRTPKPRPRFGTRR